MSIILVNCLYLIVVISYIATVAVSPRVYWLAIALHAILLTTDVYTGGIGLGQLISFLLLGTVLITWKGLDVKFSQRLLIVITVFGVITPLLLTDKSAIPIYSYHVVLALLAYISAGASFFYWLDTVLSERLLKTNPTVLPNTPILQRENRCILFVTISFSLLTLTLMSGFYNAFSHNLPLFDITHKNIFAILTWLTFLVLLIGRHFFGWRGKKALIYYFTGCVFLLSSYIVSTSILTLIN